MEPINNQWTTPEVEAALYEAAKLGFTKAAKSALDKLLRRREQETVECCVQACDDAMQQVAANDSDWDEKFHATGFVRGLTRAKSLLRELI